MHVTKIEDLAEKLGTRNFSFKILSRHVNEHDSATYTITINSTEEFEATINEPQNKRWVTLSPVAGIWYHAKLQRYEDYDTWAFVPLGEMSRQPIDEEELPDFEEVTPVETPIKLAGELIKASCYYLTSGKIALRTGRGKKLIVIDGIKAGSVKALHGKIVKLETSDDNIYNLIGLVKDMSKAQLSYMEKQMETEFSVTEEPVIEEEYNPFDGPREISEVIEKKLDTVEEEWYNTIPQSGYLCFDPDTHLVMLVFDHTSDKEQFIPLSQQEALELLLKPKRNNDDI